MTLSSVEKQIILKAAKEYYKIKSKKEKQEQKVNLLYEKTVAPLTIQLEELKVPVNMLTGKNIEDITTIVSESPLKIEFTETNLND